MESVLFVHSLHNLYLKKYKVINKKEMFRKLIKELKQKRKDEQAYRKIFNLLVKGSYKEEIKKNLVKRNLNSDLFGSLLNIYIKCENRNPEEYLKRLFLKFLGNRRKIEHLVGVLFFYKGDKRPFGKIVERALDRYYFHRKLYQRFFARDVFFLQKIILALGECNQLSAYDKLKKIAKAEEYREPPLAIAAKMALKKLDAARKNET